MASSKPSASTIVLLVRHGRTPTTGKILPGRAKGLHLAPEGVAQAEEVGRSLAEWQANQAPKSAKQRPSASGKGIAAVYASPMERTYETATPIARSLGLRVRKNKGLLEADFGDWTGKKLKDLYKKPEWETVQRYPSGFRFPGGESFAEMQLRMVAALAELSRAHVGETIVAVSHADTIKAAAAHALGTHLDLFQRIVINPCTVTAIQYTANGPYVLGLNTTGSNLQAVVTG